MEPLRVVFVCTGNRCRSPFAAAYLKALAGERVATASYAARGAPGQPSPGDMIEAASRHGIDLSAHRSVAEPGSDADVVIGFELEHVAAAVVEGGAPSEQTFQLRELVELLEPVPDDDPRAMIAAAHELRRARPPRVYGHVADPFGGSRKDYERVTAEMVELLDRLATRLALGP